MRATTPAYLLLLLPMLVLGAPAGKTSPGPESAPAAKPAVPAQAGTSTGSRFEGVLNMRLTMESGSGDLDLSLSGDMAKLDMRITVSPLPEPIRLAVLMDARTPKTAYLVSDPTRSYSAINIADAAGKSGEGKDKGKYKVRILGQEKILGFACTHVTLTRGQDLIDAWITKDMPDVYAVLKKLQEANPQIGEAELFRALEETGNAGLPMRCIVVRDGQRVTTEVRKVERRALPASLFAIPKGYTRTEGGAAGLQPTPEQIEEMKRIIEGALEGR